MAQHRYLDAPRSPLTEIVDSVSVIDLRSELAAVLNSPDPFNAEQSRYGLSHQLLDRLFVTYVPDNFAAAADNMQQERISENVID